MFRLNKEEFDSLRFQFGILKRGRHSKYLPYAFTENGVAMLSSVLNSKRAVQVNIRIMRTFTKLREMLLTHKDLRQKIEEMEKKYDYQFTIVFDAIKQLLESPAKSKKTDRVLSPDMLLDAFGVQWPRSHAGAWERGG